MKHIRTPLFAPLARGEVVLLSLLCLNSLLALADTTATQAIATTAPITANAAASRPLAPIPNAQQLFSGLVDKAIKPLYQELDTASQQLTAASQAFCTATDSGNFARLRTAWVNTLLAWQRTDPLLFGPAVENEVDYHINFNPPKKRVINQLLADSTPITVAALEQKGVGGQGLSTLEYLLYDRDKTEADLLAAFQGEAGQRRCAYVQAASELLQRHIHTLTDAWLRQDNSFADALRQAGHGSAVFSSDREALDLLVSKLYQTAEKLTLKLGKPMGIIIQGAPNPYELEAWRSGQSIAITRAHVEGMQRLLREGGWLEWLRTHYDNPLAQQITAALEQLTADYLKIPEPATDPFVLLEQGDKQALMEFYQRSYGIQMGIKRQLAKLLDVRFGFNDNDGD